MTTTAPNTPGELLAQLAIWHAEHESRPASLQQTGMTMLYSAVRDVVDEHRGNANVRDALLAHFPDLQEQIWRANAVATGRGIVGSVQRVNAPPYHRLDLCKSTCGVRDDRWDIHIDAGDSPVSIRVQHRQYGDYYDWPEAVFDQKVKAAERAYTLQDESNYDTRGRALKAAHDFLRSYGAGEVEYLEWDVNSQSMVVVGHSPRCASGLWWPEAKPDPLAPFHEAGSETSQ